MNAQPNQDDSSQTWIGCWVIGAVIVILGGLFFGFALLMAGMIVPIEFVVYTLFGWAFFLRHAWTDVQVNPIGLATGATALVLFSVGLHQFLKWLYAAHLACSSTSSSDEARTLAPTRWRVKWTAYVVVLVCVMFVAGISMVGFAHQIVWLTTTQEKIVFDRSGLLDERAKRVKEKSMDPLQRGIGQDEDFRATPTKNSCATCALRGNRVRNRFTSNYLQSW